MQNLISKIMPMHVKQEPIKRVKMMLRICAMLFLSIINTTRAYYKNFSSMYNGC